jgi:hypothetical protein
MANQSIATFVKIFSNVSGAHGAIATFVGKDFVRANMVLLKAESSAFAYDAIKCSA